MLFTFFEVLIFLNFIGILRFLPRYLTFNHLTHIFLSFDCVLLQPIAGTYGYTVSEEGMFDYDNPIVEKATDDLDLVLRNACRAALVRFLKLLRLFYLQTNVLTSCIYYCSFILNLPEKRACIGSR